MKLFDVYPLFDINIVKGKGCHVWDEQGTEYLDLYGGHAVISIGHAHPHYVEMISKQVATLGFYSNSVINKLQQTLAERLGKVCGYDDYALFLINSGAEANENALKLASFYNGRTRLISFNKAFHGRTSLAVEVTNNPKIIAPVNDCGHVTYLPLNDTEAMKAELRKGDVCAVIIEGIQGVGGIQLPTTDFLKALREECTQTNTVLILDEIQCGMGRSGQIWAFQKAGIVPDVILMSKAIGGSQPMSVVVYNKDLDKWSAGAHAGTFRGNQLAMAAGTVVLNRISDQNFLDEVRRKGNVIKDAMLKLKSSISIIGDVRGRGLMLGVEFIDPNGNKDIMGNPEPSGEIAAEIQKRCFEKGLIMEKGGRNGSVMRCLCALTVSDSEISTMLDIFSSAAMEIDREITGR